MKHFISMKRPLLAPLLTKDLDGIIVPLENYAMRQSDYVPLDALSETVEQIKAARKTVWVNMNGIFHQPDLDGLKQAFEQVVALDVDGILFADLAVQQLAADYGVTDKLIYYPETYVTADEDLVFWAHEGIHSAVAAKEMTLDDLSAMHEKRAMPLTILGHGYINMFHSKRTLLKTFFKYSKDKPTQSTHKKTFNIVESLRDETYPIYQDAFGTHIFRSQPLQSFSVYDTLKQYVDYLMIDTQFYSNERIMQIVDDYGRCRAGNEPKGQYDDHDQGFYFKKTVYAQSKEELI